jgi:hypothetical protein
MNFNTAYNHSVRLKDRVKNIHENAKYSCPTHQELILLISQEIYGDPAWPKLPGWAQQEVTNLHGFLFHVIQQSYTIWLFPQPEGPALAWDEMPEEVRQTYCSADKKGEMYWLRRRPGVTAKGEYDGKARTVTRVLEITDKIW